MTTNKSIQINNLINDLVSWYATSSNTDRQLKLYVSDIPEQDLNNLAGLIISQDDDYAAESTGFDNDDFQRSMLPALITALRGKKNGYTSEEFRDIWTSGVRSYLMPVMQKMIDEVIDDLNGEQGCHIKLVWDRKAEKTMEIRSST
jgi:hypothetical protein